MIKEENKLQDKVKSYSWFSKKNFMCSNTIKGFTYLCNDCNIEIWIPYSKKNPTGLCYKCSRKKLPKLQTEGNKICTSCKQDLDISKFTLVHNKTLIKSQCTKCLNLFKYGINKNDFDKLLLDQNNVCAICEKKSDYNSLNVDHDHITGKVRGLLCGNCNKGLGLFNDNSELLVKASKYLKND